MCYWILLGLLFRVSAFFALFCSQRQSLLVDVPYISYKNKYCRVSVWGRSEKAAPPSIFKVSVPDTHWPPDLATLPPPCSFKNGKWKWFTPFQSKITPTYQTWGPFCSWHKAADMHFQTTSHFSLFQRDFMQLFLHHESFSWNVPRSAFENSVGAEAESDFSFFFSPFFSFGWDVGECTRSSRSL